MAHSPICSVDDCSNPATRRGWCSAHYQRWRRHGDPLVGGALVRYGGPLRYFTDVVLLYSGDDCLIWPYGRNDFGYGMLWANGRKSRVHRLACEATHGEPPTPGHDAAHLCGNGHNGCVNPHHLQWKTDAENEADKVAHGTSNRGERHGMAKLQRDHVVEIRRLCGTMPQSEIARRFGISQAAVSAINSRKAWAWLE